MCEWCAFMMHTVEGSTFHGSRCKCTCHPHRARYIQVALFPQTENGIDDGTCRVYTKGSSQHTH